MKHIEYKGKCALVHYRGGVLGGEVVDDCSSGKPVEIVLGAGQVPPGIDEAIYDMAIGERRRVVIPSEKAYGDRVPEYVQAFPRTMLACGGSLKEGDFIPWTHPVSGRDVPVKVVKATDVAVVVDFNHPLAGETLDYWIELLDVIDADGVSIRDRES